MSTERDSAVPLGRTAAWLAKQIDVALASVDLSPPQYRILGALHEGVSSKLAERLAVRPPSVTAVVDGLVQRGLVERRHGAQDRRRVEHVLTPEGSALLAAADAAVEARLASIAGCLPDPADATRALEGLALWHQALSVHRQGARAEPVVAR